MTALDLVLYILSAICFILAFAIRPIAGGLVVSNPNPNGWWHPTLKISLIALGAFFFVLIDVINGFEALR